MTLSKFYRLHQLESLLEQLELSALDKNIATKDSIDSVVKNDSIQVEKPIMVQARLHHSRKKGSVLFMLLRQSGILVQCIGFKKTIPDIFKDLLTIPRESVIQVQGIFRKAPCFINTTNNWFEIEIQSVEVISQAPRNQMSAIQVEDLNMMGQENTKGRPEVSSLLLRLDHRYMDLRSNLNQALFRIRASMEMLFREFLTQKKFMEIHTPKLISCPSESGASVFEVKYFDQTAYLAQSPQLYKQMMINSDFQRVFEIGAVYRAEKSFGHRHLCEFMGLDLEMELDPWNAQTSKGYQQVFNIINSMFSYVTGELEVQCCSELETLEQFFSGSRIVIDKEIPVISYSQGVEWLNQKGFKQAHDRDLNNQAEKLLGEIVLEKLNSQIFFLDKYPSNLRPFYTMIDDQKDPISGLEVTRSYDLIYKGTEIASGAQRINDYSVLVENIKKHGLTEKHYQSYLDSFKYGSPPHAGIGLGLERLIGLHLNIPDVHMTTLLPRDPNRLTP